MLKTTSLLFLILLIHPALAQSSWQLKKEKEGIEVYTRSVAGSSFKEFKGIAKIEASLSTLVAVLLDVENFTAWMPNSKEVRLLEKGGPTDLTYYLSTDAPWPVSDRDGVYRSELHREPESEIITIYNTTDPDYLPEKSGYVRIMESEGFWKLKPLGEGQTEVVYQNHSEPGGAVPGWLAASSVISIPFDTIKKLRVQAKTGKYRNVSLLFLN